MGSNTVPALLNAMHQNPSLRELTIDLECFALPPPNEEVSRQTLMAFCHLISVDCQSSPSFPTSRIRKVSLICSGEEDISKKRLQRLGKALQQLQKSIRTVRFSGMKTDHLSVLLSHMNKPIPKKCCSCGGTRTGCLPCHSRNSATCPKSFLPRHGCDLYQSILYVPSDHVGSFPSQLHLERIFLFHDVLFQLGRLLFSSTRIQHLTLESCSQYAVDRDFLQLLLQGETCLQELTLKRHVIMATSWPLPPQRHWWQPSPPRASSITRNAPSCFWKSHHPPPQRLPPQLKRLRLTDLFCNDDAILNQIATTVADSVQLERLVLTMTSNHHHEGRFVQSMLQALHTSMVVEGRPNNLGQLWILVGATSLDQNSVHRDHDGDNANNNLVFGSRQFHQLASILSHTSTCGIYDCLLDVGASHPGLYHMYLNVLANGITLNTSLHKLTLASGGDGCTSATTPLLDDLTLERFVSRLVQAPQLKWLKLRFPGMVDTDPHVVGIFQRNTTLERVELLSCSTDGDVTTSANSTNAERQPSTTALACQNALAYFGLRNRIGSLLLARGSWTNGTWRSVLQTLLKWYDDEDDRTVVAMMDSESRELVFLSGLWYAMLECPMMVTELARKSALLESCGHRIIQRRHSSG